MKLIGGRDTPLVPDPIQAKRHGLHFAGLFSWLNIAPILEGKGTSTLELPHLMTQNMKMQNLVRGFVSHPQGATGDLAVAL